MGSTIHPLVMGPKNATVRAIRGTPPWLQKTAHLGIPGCNLLVWCQNKALQVPGPSSLTDDQSEKLGWTGYPRFLDAQPPNGPAGRAHAPSHSQPCKGNLWGLQTLLPTPWGLKVWMGVVASGWGWLEVAGTTTASGGGALALACTNTPKGSSKQPTLRATLMQP